MLAATFAMTMARLNEWRINFKPNAATETTPANAFAHPRINSRRSTSQQLSAASWVETRSMFQIFVKESEDVALPLRNPKIEKIVSVVRCFTNRRINFQQMRLVPTLKLIGQCVTWRSAVIVCGLNQHDRCRCFFCRSSQPLAQFRRTFPRT